MSDFETNARSKHSSRKMFSLSSVSSSDGVCTVISTEHWAIRAEKTDAGMLLPAAIQ